MEVIDKMEQCMHSHPPNIPQSYPWLVIRDENHQERQNFFSISENHFYQRTISEMRNKTICTSAKAILHHRKTNQGYIRFLYINNLS